MMGRKCNANKFQKFYLVTIIYNIITYNIYKHIIRQIRKQFCSVFNLLCKEDLQVGLNFASSSVEIFMHNKSNAGLTAVL